jgi:hypothetical protein
MISESCAQEALKMAIPLNESVEKTVGDLAMASVTTLRQYNEKYTDEHNHLSDNFLFVKAEPARADERVVVALTIQYLRLLNRRGLINV